MFPEEESYPVDVQQVHPKIGQKPKMVTCFTFAAKSYLPKQKHDQGRRHTISGFEIHDIHRFNLRDDLLRFLAEKEARSLHKIEEEKKELPIESYNKHRVTRRSSLVTDVIKTVRPPKEDKKEPKQRKASLVSDVIKFVPKNASRRGSLAGSKVDLHKPPQSQPQSERDALGMTNSPTTNQRMKDPNMRIPGGRDSRMKEISKLKYTSAARAAKMAFNEAHISMQANRRLSLQGPDHYLTLQTVVKIQGMKDNIEKDTSANTKFINWRKKFQAGLQQET